MHIYCLYDELINPKDIKPHRLNVNEHGQDQIEHLAKLYKYHGIRLPIIVSKLSNQIVSGHCRRLSAIRAGIDKFPVVYQDFKDSEAEYAFLVADNAIQDQSMLNMKDINSYIENLGPDFDIDNLGIKDFTLDFAEKLEEPKKKKAKKLIECPNCGEII